MLPRDTPTFRFIRVAVLLISTWLLVLGSLLTTLFGLMFIGRQIGGILLMALPEGLGITLHDPLCMVIGIQVALSFIRTYRRFSIVLRYGNVIFTRIPLRGHLFCKY